MDVVLQFCDEQFFTPLVYPEWFEPENIWRQILSLLVIVNVGAYLLYFLCSGTNYILFYDKRHLKHPQFLPNQVRMEIETATKHMFLMSIPTIAVFLAEIHGYGKLYDNVHDVKLGWWAIALSFVSFLLFTDFLIYWIHRWLHLPVFYKNLHKLHHKWKVSTPFASHAFYWLDGFAQSVPYHVYAMMIPMHKYLYLILFILVNIWTVSIHDGIYLVPGFLKNIVNGSAHHMDHHLFYNYNYGQYLTLWDRIGGSFREPSSYEGDGPLDQLERKEKESKKVTTRKDK